MGLGCLFTELSAGRGKSGGMEEQEQSASCKASKMRSAESQSACFKNQNWREQTEQVWGKLEQVNLKRLSSEPVLQDNKPMPFRSTIAHGSCFTVQWKLNLLCKSCYILFVESKHRSSGRLLLGLWLMTKSLLNQPKILHFPFWNYALKLS